MRFLPNSATQFDDVYELTYNLLNSIGLSIDANGYLYDQDSRTHIQFHGCKIKASVTPNVPCYAGQGEVVFDILYNIRLVTVMLGYCIDKETKLNGFSCLSHFIEDIPGTRTTAITMKMTDGSYKTTKYYMNKCLKYIHAIFLVYDENVDLSNFDEVIQ